MEYFVAPSYKNYQRVGDPYLNDKGKLVTKVTCKCERCGGSGIYASRVENGEIVPFPAFGGVCLKCNGSGWESKVVRLYTESEYNTLMKQKEREAQKKEETMKVQAEQKKAEWLTKNGFDAEGYTYILVGLDSYAIKDQLKENNWKYNNILRWHKEDPGEFTQNVHKMHWTEAYSASAWGDMYPIGGAQKKVDNLIEEAKGPSLSEWVGEVGQKVKEIPVTLKNIYGYDGRYGYSEIYIFVDDNLNKLTWFTASKPKVNIGDKVLLTATIKKHDIYRNEKTTIITRAKVQSI